MESNLIQMAAFLEEVDLNNVKLTKLETETANLKEVLIEKESDLHAKAVQCHLLEVKLKKAHNELKHVVEENNCRLNSMQQEIVRLEASNVDTIENYRRIQMEKQKIALNFAHLQNEVQEIKKHVRSATDRIPEIRFKHANLFKDMKELEDVQVKIIEVCEVTQTRVVKAVKEVTDKLEASRQLHEQHQELERSLCASNARIKLLEKGRCDSLLQKKIEMLTKQLEMLKERENRLRLDLQEKTEQNIIFQQQRDEALCKVADFLEFAPIENRDKLSSERTDHP